MEVQKYPLVFGFFLFLIAILVHGEEILFKHEKLSIFRDEDGTGFSVRNKHNRLGLSGRLSLGASFPGERCYSGDFCRQEAGRRVEINVTDSCFHFATMSVDPDVFPHDCIDLGTAHWFGGPEQYVQHWPLEKLSLADYSYVTKSQDNMAVVERYWLNSNGAYLYVDPGVPLFVDQNNRRNNSLCLSARNAGPYVPRPTLVLSYSVCGLDSGDARDAHYDAIDRFLHRPTGVPNERMFRHPVWSTWARYKADISQDKVFSFAREIVDHGFYEGQLEIDDLWETCYGSLTFDTRPSKFPNMAFLSAELISLGFRVTLWVHPFINYGCEPHHSFAVERGYLVKNMAGSVETQWWNGNASIIDFTNPEAVDWWVGNLQKLVDNEQVNSFKFDAGETSWVPQVPKLNATIEQQPGIYTRKYAEACARFGDLIEVRVGQYTQDLPVFVRMIDKDSRWGINNGLRSLVTTLLQMNMVGYPFVLPDMIGGNGYNGELPSKELFIRWLQANTFMPTLQFSYVPWDYDDETVNISKTFTELHDTYTDHIMALARKAVEDGTPINPPIWWIDPEDEDALAIDDEFLLGDTVLVAPVLEEGATSRDVYLPRGVWRDEVTGEGGLVGPVWIRNYPAPLAVLPYFTKMADGPRVDSSTFV